MRLSDPIEIRHCRLASRTVMAPMVPNLAGTDGAVTPVYRDFYLERARAGVGFILLGGVYVHPDGRGFNNQLGIYDDRLIPGLEQLVTGIKPHCPVGVQLSFKSISRMPETFSPQEISRYCQAFAQGAVRAKKAGFDAVELHACHDYWLNYFLSPHFNHRSDAYGGSLENRFRLLREVVLAVREALGQELVLGVRLSLDEFVDDGLKPFETTQAGIWLEALGVDYLSASGGIGLTQHRMSPPMEVERGSLLPLALTLKQAVGIPVIGVGRLDRPEVMRSAVSTGNADMAAVARSLIADPAYAVKTLQNRDSDIRPCVACNFCLLRLHQGQALRCAVNPRAGRESESFAPLDRDVYTVVVGGGPAGLSYAAAAAGRGARVRLYERKAEVGGMVTVGSRPPFKDVLEDFIRHLNETVHASGVDVLTGCEVDAETLRKESAHKMVIATGAVPLILPVDGAAQSDRVCTAVDILGTERPAPGRYLVIGGGAVGLETAEYLVFQGGRVTLIEMTDNIGSGLHMTRLRLLTDRLSQSGVPVMKNTRLVSLDGGFARVRQEDAEFQLGPFDRFVFAVGSASNNPLAEALGVEMNIEVIGDAREPLGIYEAVRDGHDAAMRL